MREFWEFESMRRYGVAVCGVGVIIFSGRQIATTFP
jgi:hypothetical protein